MTDRLFSTLTIVFSAILNFCLFFCLAIVFKISDSNLYAISCTCTLMIHELGHFFAFEACGVKCCAILFFLTTPIKKYTLKGRSLSLDRRLCISIAGCFANLAIIPILFILYKFNCISYHEFSFMSMLNGVFSFFNLLPFKKSDGRRVWNWLVGAGDEIRNVDPMPLAHQNFWLSLFMFTLIAALLFALNRAGIMV